MSREPGQMSGYLKTSLADHILWRLRSDVHFSPSLGNGGSPIIISGANDRCDRPDRQEYVLCKSEFYWGCIGAIRPKCARRGHMTVHMCRQSKSVMRVHMCRQSKSVMRVHMCTNGFDNNSQQISNGHSENLKKCNCRVQVASSPPLNANQWL
jgi:hypothetical protein